MITPPAIVHVQAPEDRVASTIQERAAELRKPLKRDEAVLIASEVLDASAKHHVPVAMALAVIEVESAYDKDAHSSAACVGLMQLNPNTAPWLAKLVGLKRYRLTSIKDNIQLGVLYLAYLFSKYKRWDLALTAYNKGIGTLRKQRYTVGRYARLVWEHFEALGSTLTPEFALEN